MHKSSSRQLFVVRYDFGSALCCTTLIKAKHQCPEYMLAKSDPGEPQISRTSVFLFCLNRQCFFCQEAVLRFSHKSHMVRIRKTSGHRVLCRGLKTSSGFTHKHVENTDSNCVCQLVGLAACDSTTNTSRYVSQAMNTHREHDVLYECQRATVRSICGLRDQISHIKFISESTISSFYLLQHSLGTTGMKASRTPGFLSRLSLHQSQG